MLGVTLCIVATSSVALSSSAYAQTSNPPTAPSAAPTTAPVNPIQQIQNGLNQSLADIINQMPESLRQQNLPQLSTVFRGLMDKLNLPNLTEPLNELQAQAVALLYRHGDPIWFYPPPEPVGTLCNQCCSAPEKVFAHQIRGTDPLGQDDLQKMITRDLIPLIKNKFAEVSARLTTHQLANSALIGNVREAQSNIKSLQSYQTQSANAILNGQSSEQVCRIASVAQSLGASELYSRSVQLNLMDYVRDRSLLRENMNSGYRSARNQQRAEGAGDMGPAADMTGRWHQFSNVFCDPNNQDMKRENVCTNTVVERANRDIDFTRTADNARPLDIRISPDTAQRTNDLEAIMALGNNLYAPRLMVGERGPRGEGATERMMKQRSLYAMRNIVANSYAAFVSERAAGTPKAAEPIKALLSELGGDPNIVGERPSYDMQMNAVSRQLYQTPEFYKNLMESGTNVKRQQVALQSIELMNKRDIYESLERSEMLMALWLEIKLRKNQDGIVNRMGDMK